jgi:two-component system sensor histidine kinase DctS
LPRPLFLWQRWSLWALLAVLVVGMLVTLVWLAGRHEVSQVQGQLERDTADAVADLRTALTRNVQSLQALQALQGNQADPAGWVEPAAALLREHREWLRIEWRDASINLLAHANTPYRVSPFERMGRPNAMQEVALACATARKFNGPAYSSSYFLPQNDGQGLEVMELCLPLMQAGRITGYLLATYSLHDVLTDLIGKQVTRSQEVSFTEVDGTRLAMHGPSRRGSRVFTAQQLIDLPGNTLVLRIDGWRGAPDLFPNVLTALVTGMSIALVSVLILLVRDMRRRLKAEHDLADALAFRKAMEDSLVTGLRARDLQGRVTYVNPAFCKMVGYEAHELVGRGMPAPYWPPDKFAEYGERQALRMAGDAPAREGAESVFMRRDGERFPVLIFEAPLINAGGTQTGWMGAILDMSEQRRVEELSRATQERLQATARLATVGEMASLLSHELNQPLAAIASYATGSLNLLQHSGEPDRASLTQAVARIAEQAERAGKVIKSVHDFVRRREYARESVRPEALFDAVLPLVSLQARKLGVRVMVLVDEGLPPVLCDRTMVEQVLLNLSRNAMQAMDQPGIGPRELVLRAQRADPVEGRRWLEFSVADVGVGIAPEVAARLFTPFFTTRKEGMGLGLSMCRTVVEQHGGLLVYGPNGERGTIFRFTLPVLPPSAPVAPARVPASSRETTADN